MVYTRGASDDYDRLAKIAGDDGWTWDNLHPYILKVSYHYMSLSFGRLTLAIAQQFRTVSGWSVMTDERESINSL